MGIARFTENMIKIFKHRNEIPINFRGKCVFSTSKQCVRDITGIPWFNASLQYNQEAEFNCEHTNGLLNKSD